MSIIIDENRYVHCSSNIYYDSIHYNLAMFLFVIFRFLCPPFLFPVFINWFDVPVLIPSNMVIAKTNERSILHMSHFWSFRLWYRMVVWVFFCCFFQTPAFAPLSVCFSLNFETRLKFQKYQATAFSTYIFCKKDYYLYLALRSCCSWYLRYYLSNEWCHFYSGYENYDC